MHRTFIEIWKVTSVMFLTLVRAQEMESELELLKFICLIFYLLARWLNPYKSQFLNIKVENTIIMHLVFPLWS